MPEDENWVDVGHADEFSATPLKRVTAMNIELAISFKDGKFGAVSNAATMSAGRLATAGWIAIISSALAQLEISPL